MSISKRHHTKQRAKRNLFYGEEFGIPVAHFLNTGPKPRRERVRALLTELLDVPPLETPVSSSELHKLSSLNQRLSRYKTAPALLPKGQFEAEYGRVVPRLRFRRGPVGKRGPDRLECDAVHNLIRLKEIGMLERVRQCKNPHPSCGEWFFSRMPQGRFCGKPCQIRFNASTEKTKQRRRENYKYKLIQKERQSSRKGARHGNV